MPTPAVIDINADGVPDVVVGLDDTILGSGPAGAGVQAFLLAFDGRGNAAPGGALLPGYPAKIPGLIQGYGVAQDFVTQGVESPAVYSDPTSGPQAVVNANLFLPFRVDLGTPSQQNPFTASTINPAPTASSCPTPGTVPPTNPGQCTLVQFTTSASLGKLAGALPVPGCFRWDQRRSTCFSESTQVPGFGVPVDNGLGGWDPTTGAQLGNFKNDKVRGSPSSAPRRSRMWSATAPDVIVSGDSGAIMAFSGATGQPFERVPQVDRRLVGVHARSRRSGWRWPNRRRGCHARRLPLRVVDGGRQQVHWQLLGQLGESESRDSKTPTILSPSETRP